MANIKKPAVKKLTVSRTPAKAVKTPMPKIGKTPAAKVPMPKITKTPAMPTRRPAVGADKAAAKKYGKKNSWNNGYTN